MSVIRQISDFLTKDLRGDSSSQELSLVAKIFNFVLFTWLGRAGIAFGTVAGIFGLWLAWFLIAPVFLEGNRADEELLVTPTNPAMTSEMNSNNAGAGGGTEETGDPVLIRTGTFNYIDGLHNGDGMANIYRTAEGKHVLQLEEFRVSNGPQLAVCLATNGGINSTRSDLGEHRCLRTITGLGTGNITSGNLSIEIPDDLDIPTYQSVVIYCEPFSVVFTAAELSNP